MWKERLLGSAVAIALLSAAMSQPTVVDSDLVIETIFSTGASPQPIMFEFLRPDDPSEFFVADRSTGRVRLIRDGNIVSTVLDLPVNFPMERGLLGLALDPNFAQNGYVYLYYSRSISGNDSSTSTDWDGNYLERYRWDGNALVDRTILLHVAPDPTQSNSVHHHGGVIRIGADGKLYVTVGDLDRGKFTNPRIEQNTGTSQAACAGGIYRLNLDSTIPDDNPFVSHSNPCIQRMWAYGVRNSFGLAFDPFTGFLWFTENGPEVYDEVNIVRQKGFNSGWRKIIGPDSRDASGSWNGNTVYNAADLVMLSGAYYEDPKFSWLTPIGVTAIFFIGSARYSSVYHNSALIADHNNGAIYRFPLDTNREGFSLDGDLADLVADTVQERNSLRWSTGWSVVTDMKIGPDGYLYVCSVYTPARGIYRIRPVNPPEIVHGKAHLEGYNGLPLGIPLTLTLTQGSSTVQTITTTLDAFGKFSARVNAPGTYTIRAKAGSYLSVEVPATVAAQGYAYFDLNFTTNGDANGDEAIDDADLLEVLFAFGQSGGNADLNGDGTVDDADLLIVLFNFGAGS